MHKAKLFLLSLSLALTSSFAVKAEPAKPAVETLITDTFIGEVREWLANPIVSLSVKAQNRARGHLDQKVIDELDQRWRKETKADDKPLISATLSAPLSIYLIRVQANSVGLYSELFVMDQNGLNVGQSAITGDYWQGDEAKFQKTFPEGSGAVFMDEPEWDDALKIWRGQLNLTLSDPETGEPIGSATVEINLTELQRRQGQTS